MQKLFSVEALLGGIDKQGGDVFFGCSTYSKKHISFLGGGFK